MSFYTVLTPLVYMEKHNQMEFHIAFSKDQPQTGRTLAKNPIMVEIVHQNIELFEESYPILFYQCLYWSLNH